MWQTDELFTQTARLLTIIRMDKLENEVVTECENNMKTIRPEISANMTSENLIFVPMPKTIETCENHKKHR